MTLIEAAIERERQTYLYAKVPVEIVHSDETGEWVWVVTTDDCFWLDAFETREEAIAFCQTHGLPLVGEK
jgi:hypothetical protein